VTDWRPASGTATGSFARILYAGDLSKAPERVPAMLEKNAPMGRATLFNPALVAGMEAEDPVLGAEQAAGRMIQLVRQEEAAAAAREHGQGDRQRDWKINADVSFRGPLQLGLVPLAKAVWAYGSQRPSFWLEGADLASVINDPLPRDKARDLFKEMTDKTLPASAGYKFPKGFFAG
jgi:hypothetical protein